MQPRARRIPTDNGVSIHVLEWSETGTPLVLVHGFGNEAHIWDDFAPLVAPHYRTVAVDLRGHGDSAHDPERRYDYDFHVADLEAVTAALGIERLRAGRALARRPHLDAVRREAPGAHGRPRDRRHRRPSTIRAARRASAWR